MQVASVLGCGDVSDFLMVPLELYSSGLGVVGSFWWLFLLVTRFGN